MTKTQLLKTVGEYYAAKGEGFLSLRDYKADVNHPVPPRLVMRYFGAWSRLETKIRRYFPALAGEIDIAAVPAEEDFDDTDTGTSDDED